MLDALEKRAYDCEFTYHGCSQCVLLALQEAFDLKDEAVFKASSGLGGGVGRMQSVCGALLGGALVLGMKYGRSGNELENTEVLFRSFKPVEKLYRRFEKEFGTVMCRQIREQWLGEYLDTKILEQYEKSVAMGIYKRCSEIASKTARMTGELLLE